MNYDPDNAGHRAALALDIKATLAGLGFQQVDVAGVKELVFARIDANTCTGCHMCVETCAPEAIVQQPQANTIRVHPHA